jgi:hypothetical protein
MTPVVPDIAASSGAATALRARLRLALRTAAAPNDPNRRLIHHTRGRYSSESRRRALLRGAGTRSSAVPNTLTNSSSRSASLTRLYASA